MVGVMRVVSVIHGGNVGRHRRLHIVIVIGGDANEFGAFNEEAGVTEEGDAHWVWIERGEPERRGRKSGLVAGDKSRTILSHFRRRRFRRLRLLRLRRSVTPRRPGGERRGEKQRGQYQDRGAWQAQLPSPRNSTRRARA